LSASVVALAIVEHEQHDQKHALQRLMVQVSSKHGIENIAKDATRHRLQHA
jgi:hypothetical protein